MHVEHMTFMAVRVDIPDDLVVETHVEDGVIGEHKPVDGVERGRHVHPARGEQVGELRMPDGEVAAEVPGDVVEGGTRAGRVDVVRLGVDLGHERVGFVVAHELEYELAVRRHGGVHHPPVVDDLGPQQAAVHVLLRAHEGLVPSQDRGLVRRWSVGVVDEELVDGASAGRDGVEHPGRGFLSGRGIVGIGCAFAVFAIC